MRPGYMGDNYSSTSEHWSVVLGDWGPLWWVIEYTVGKWERERQNGPCAGKKGRSEEFSEETADMGGLFVPQGHGNIWVWVAAKGHVWVCGPDLAIVVCVDVHGFCYHLGPHGHPEAGSPHVIMSVSTWCAPIGAMPF